MWAIRHDSTCLPTVGHHIDFVNVGCQNDLYTRLVWKAAFMCLSASLSKVMRSCISSVASVPILRGRFHIQPTGTIVVRLGPHPAGPALSNYCTLAGAGLGARFTQCCGSQLPRQTTGVSIGGNKTALASKITLASICVLLPRYMSAIERCYREGVGPD